MHFHHVICIHYFLYLAKHFQVVFHWKWYTIITFWKNANTFWRMYEKAGWSMTRCVQMMSWSMWQNDVINLHVVKRREGSSSQMVYILIDWEIYQTCIFLIPLCYARFHEKISIFWADFDQYFLMSILNILHEILHTA